MPKILHISGDEKFIDAANYLYEKAFPNSNTFFIITANNKDYKLNYIKNISNYTIYSKNRKSVNEISKQIKNYDLIVLHNLLCFHAKIVKKNPKAIYNWVFFGAEIYNRHNLFKNSILGDKTKKLIKKELIFKKYKTYLRNIIKYGVPNTVTYAFKYIKHIDYFTILHKEEYNLFLEKGILDSKMKWLKYTYYPIEFIFNKNKDVKINGNNILLGNSAALTNNSIEAIDILKTLDLGDRKVIIPLSYGDLQYIDDIINYGKKELGNNFYPITNFMPLDDYNNMLQTCNVLIINSYRQQAVGNILASMWMGAKVFLDYRNTFYHYLKRIGCSVYLINDLSDTNLNNLSFEQIEYNRKILLQEIGEEIIVKTLKGDIINIIT